MTRRRDAIARGPIPAVYASSLLVALLLAVGSAGGLLFPSHLYPTEELRQSFLANDVANLAIGLPALLGSMWLARWGRLVGLLLWPGTLLYVVYNSIAYVFALPPNLGFLLSLLLLASSVYAMAGLVATIDGEAVRRRLSSRMYHRLGGGVLIGLGVAFSLRVVGILVQALVAPVPVSEAELPVLVSDFLTAPASVIGGLLLWRREPLGYVVGLGLLFQASMLFIGLIVFLLVQPLVTTAPFRLADVAVVGIMSLVCLAPFAVIVRATVSADGD
jgi:hypothetical protein